MPRGKRLRRLEDALIGAAVRSGKRNLAVAAVVSAMSHTTNSLLREREHRQCLQYLPRAQYTSPPFLRHRGRTIARASHKCASKTRIREKCDHPKPDFDSTFTRKIYPQHSFRGVAPILYSSVPFVAVTHGDSCGRRRGNAQWRMVHRHV